MKSINKIKFAIEEENKTRQKNYLNINLKKSYSEEDLVKSIKDYPSTLPKKIRDVLKHINNLKERIDMISEDLKSTELLLKELIMTKEKNELYKNIITSKNLINVQSIDLNYLGFENFSLAKTRINFNRVADLITDNLNVQNKLLIFNLFSEIISKTPIGQKQEDYFHQISKNFLMCLLNDKYKKGLIKEKIKVENLKLIIIICYKIDYHNNYIDEIIKFISITEKLHMELNNDLKHYENKLTVLIENQDLKNNDDFIIKVKRSESTANIDYSNKIKIISNNSNKIEGISMKNMEKTNNKMEKESLYKKKNYYTKTPMYNEKNLIKRNDECGIINENLDHSGLNKNHNTCEFIAMNYNSETNKSNICNLSDLRTTYNWKNPNPSQNKNIFLKKQIGDISSYKVNLNPNPINRNTVNIADNTQKIRFLTTNNLSIGKKYSKEKKLFVKIDLDNLSIEESFVMDRLKPLLEGAEIYKRIFFTNSNETPLYNFLKGDGSNPINYGFVDNFVFLDKSLQQLVFRKAFSDDKPFSSINLTSIENIEVSREMKDIVTIFQLNRQYNNSSKILEVIRIKNEVNKSFFSEEKINDCLNNEYFLLSVILKNKNRLELAFKGYSIYKYWLNGLVCAIKNKDILVKIKVPLIQNNNFVV